MTAWCSNVGDNLAVLLRPGNAGSFTAADHVRVLDHALAQIPAAHRQDVLVTVDGAGASRVLIEHLSALNTITQYPTQGRRVEYSIGWPVDERTRRAIDLAPPDAWGPGLHADGSVDQGADAIDLTGLMRSSMNGETLAGWPADMRVLARRVPRPAGQQAALGEDPDWRYSAFATNTATGQVQWLDARHRTQAYVEDNIKELKAHGARRLPASAWARNTAWLHLAALATSLTAWLRLIALDGAQAKAEIKALRYRILAAPARLITHARRRVLKDPHLGLGAGDHHRLGTPPSPPPRLTAARTPAQRATTPPRDRTLAHAGATTGPSRTPSPPREHRARPGRTRDGIARPPTTNRGRCPRGNHSFCSLFGQSRTAIALQGPPRSPRVMRGFTLRRSGNCGPVPG